MTPLPIRFIAPLLLGAALLLPACDNGRCADGLTVCGISCWDLQSHPDNCGTCGNACAEDSVCCDGTCVAPAADPVYCGAAGRCTGIDEANSRGAICEMDRECTGGDCVCTGGLTDCDAVCVDTASDRDHCGACDNACTAGNLCCEAGCIDPATDPAYCGASGDCTGDDRGAACREDQLCDQGQCVCPADVTDCVTACADLQTDALHCGMCGNPCDAGTECRDGECLPGV